MTYHNRLSNESRRAQQPDDGFGLLAYGLAMLAIIALVLVARWWLG